MASYLVQLSDPHIQVHEPANGIDTSACLRSAVTVIGSLCQAPDAVIVTGDIVDRGQDAEYQKAARLLELLKMPVYLLPGNHDDRNALRRSFPDHAYLSAMTGSAFIQYDVSVGGLRVIALDTCVPGQPYGELCAERLAWLEDRLERFRNEPVIIAMHHPPFKTLIGHMDSMGLLQGADELERLVARFANVERIICGHVHRAIEKRFGGTMVQVAPSTAHQIQLNLSPYAPPKWTLEPPGFRLFALTGGGDVVSHLVPGGQYAGPYGFDD